MLRHFSAISSTLTDNAGHYTEKYQQWAPQQDYFNSAYALIDKSFATGEVQHKLTFGYSHSDYLMKTNGSGPYSQNLSGVFNIFDQRYVSQPTITYLTDGRNRIFQRYENFLIGDQMNISSKWSAMTGLNYARYKTKSENVVDKTVSSDYQQSKTTPGFALTYKPSPAVTTYVSYMAGLTSGGTAPSSAANAGVMLPPSVIDQYEAGVKTTLGTVDVRAALFRLKKMNEYTDPSDNLYKQDGKEIHHGVELTASGKLSGNLTLVTGLTFMHARVINQDDNTAINGKIPTNVPEQQARAYLEYAVPGVDGLTVTTGAYYYGKRYVDAVNTKCIPGVTLFDAGLRYETTKGGKKTTYNLMVTNLFNKAYGDSAANNSLWLGAPRTVSLSATYEF